MKKVDFDVFSLITPLQVKPGAELDVSTPAPPSRAFQLAKAIRSNQFFLPQIELVGRMEVKGPSPVRHLRFGRYEIPDYALRKVISTLEKPEQDAIHGFLWSDGRFEYDRENRRWIGFDPVFSEQAEKAFGKVLSLLEQLAVLRPRQRRVVNDVGSAL